MASESELSEREIEILRLVATGVSNKEIAVMLTISPNTVKVHLRNVFAKIGASSRTEAALIAVRMGLIEREQAIPVVEAELSTENDEPAATALAPAELSLPLPVIEVEPRARRLAASGWLWLIAALALVFLLSLVGMALTRSGLFAPPPTAAPATPLPNVQPTAASRWSEVSALPDGRSGMGAVVYEGAIYLIGGDTAQGVSGATLRYRPSSGGWEPLLDKPTPVSDVQAVVMGEQIFVPGGRAANGKAVSVLEAYSPRLNRWDTLAPLPESLSGYALVAYEGRVYLFGGWNGSAYSANVYSYDPAGNTWQTHSALPAPRAFAAAAVIETKIYVIGGYDGKQALRTMLAYFPQRDRAGDHPWEERSPLPEGRYGMGSTALANMIYLVGGLGSASPDSPAGAARPGSPTGAARPDDLAPIQYQPANDRWSTFERQPEAVGDRPALLALETRLHVLGGKSANALLANHLTYQAIYTTVVPSIQQ